MLRCDDEGVPKIIQNIQYEQNSNTFLCFSFNGAYCRISSGLIHNCDELNPTDTNYLEAEEHAINYLNFRTQGSIIHDKYANP